MDEVGLLELAVKIPQIAGHVKQYLGLTKRDDPLNVPLEALDWYNSSLQLRDDEQYVVNEFPLQAAHLKQAVIGIDSDGNKFLARAGNVLLRYGDNSYAIVKLGVTSG